MRQGQGLVRGSIYMLIGGGLATGLRYAFQILAARWMGAADFGVVSNLFSWNLIIVGLLSAGVSLAVVRYIAQREAQGRTAKPVVANGALMLGVLLAAFVLVSLLFAGFWSEQLFSGSRFLLFILVGSVVAQSEMLLFSGVLRGFRRFKYVAVVLNVMPAVRLALVGLLVGALGYGITGAGWAILIAPVASLVVAAYWSRPLLRRDQQREPAPMPLREFVAFALPATIMTGILRFLARSGTILVNLLATENVDEMVGLFTAALVLARLPELLVEALSGPLLSNFSRAEATHDRALLKSYVLRTTQLVGVVMLAYTLFLSLAGSRLIPIIYGKGFSFPTLDMMLLAVASGLFTMAEVHSQIVVVNKGAGYVARIWALIAVVLVALSVFLPLPLYRRVEVASLVSHGLAAALLAYQSFRSVSDIRGS